jgi:hydroxypyruvate isomerase
MWGWRSKSIPRLKDALAETGAQLVSQTVDPQFDLANPSSHQEYLRALAETIAVARQLDTKYLVIVAGRRLAADLDAQRESCLKVLANAAQLAEASNLTLLLEPLNDRSDHPGTLLTSSREGLAWVKTVGSPHLRLLLDAYHALTMGENLHDLLSTEQIKLIGHVQIADVPGRGEPGSGRVDWAEQLRFLRSRGYTGQWGMEFLPTGASLEALEKICRIVSQVELQTG